jgi:hypothetical protein
MNDTFLFNFNMSLIKLKIFSCIMYTLRRNLHFNLINCLVMISARFLGRIRGLCFCRLHNHRYSNPSIVRSISLSLWDSSCGRSLSYRDTSAGTGIIRGDNSSSKSSRREYGKMDYRTLPSAPQDRLFFLIINVYMANISSAMPDQFAGFN